MDPFTLGLAAFADIVHMIRLEMDAADPAKLTAIVDVRLDLILKAHGLVMDAKERIAALNATIAQKVRDVLHPDAAAS